MRYVRVLMAAAVASAAASASAQLITHDTNVGYIDSAIPRNQVRLRFDAAYDSDFPDRAEFFYALWGNAPGGGPGPRLRETRVDYQEARAQFELVAVDTISVFGEFPVRFIDPENNPNEQGLGDVNLGVKWAFYHDDCTVVSAQTRIYTPTGDARKGLGTDHPSVEPAVLVWRRLTERLVFEGEIADWISVDGTDGVAGNVLRYGGGLSWLMYQDCRCSMSPVAELVGWTVLNGRKSNLAGSIIDADGETILNLKVGVRFGFGSGESLRGRSSLYIGYGRALSGHVWYENIGRVEYRLTF